MTGINHSSASSRNHPNYIGQGSITTKENRIDFISFATADRQNFAIVNLRLFDLNQGRVVLIAPQKDGSLLSMQIEAPPLSSGMLEPYLKDKVMKQPKVISFFSKEENI